MCAHDVRSLPVVTGVAALTCEATRASTAPFDAGNYDVRPHRGQIACAERLRLMLEGSKSVNSNKASNAPSSPLNCKRDLWCIYYLYIITGGGGARATAVKGVSWRMFSCSPILSASRFSN